MNSNEDDKMDSMNFRIPISEKIVVLRTCYDLNLSASQVIRALLAQFVREFSSGSLSGFQLEQEGMQALAASLKISQGGRKNAPKI